MITFQKYFSKTQQPKNSELEPEDEQIEFNFEEKVNRHNESSNPLWRGWQMCAEVFLVIILCASNWVFARLINSPKFSVVIIRGSKIVPIFSQGGIHVKCTPEWRLIVLMPTYKDSFHAQFEPASFNLTWLRRLNLV